MHRQSQTRVALGVLLAVGLSGCASTEPEPFVPDRSLIWEPAQVKPASYYPKPESIRWRMARGCCVRPD